MPSTYTDRLQGLATSVAVKAPCRVATTVNIALSGLQTIDGVALSAGDRVLVKNQTNPVENGIYDAQTSDWHRALDFDGSRDVVVGTQVSVVEGALQTDSYWRVTGASAPRPGVDAINFEVALFSVGSLIGFIAANRSILAGIVPAGVGQVAYLTEAGREGYFIWRTGNYAPLVGNDPLQGIYVKSESVSSASGCWVRVWDGFTARAEWFGAKVEDATVNNAPCIQAALDLGLNLKLSQGRYYIGDGSPGIGSVLLTMKANGQSLVGAGASKFSGVAGTELVIRSAAASGILVGFMTDPGGPAPNTWREGVALRDFSIRRDVANFPLGNPAVGNANSPCGVILKYAAVCTIDNVYTFEHSVGCWVAATVACKLTMRHERYTSGTSPGNDFFVGYFQDNSLATPYNSGNASLYYLGGGAFSNEAAGNTYTYNAGIQSYQGFTDTYVIGLETANCGYGVDFNGRQTATPDYHTEDLIIAQCVLDGCRWDGIRIQTGAATTAVKISDNYVGISNATGPVSNAINLREVHGSISITGNQALGVTGNPANGLVMDTSSGIVARDNIWTDISNPVVISSTVVFRVEDHINVSRVTPAVAAVQVTGSTRGKIDCEISDSSGTNPIPIGVNLVGSGNSLIEINCTNIHAASISGGSANKLKHNGTQITSTGAFGTNCLASGIMA